VVTAALAVTAVQFAAAPQPAQAAPVSCAGTVKVFDTRSDGSLWYYEHGAPATGDVSWTAGRKIGDGFHGTTVAAADGTIYYLDSAGEVRRYRYDGTKWTEGAGTLVGTEFPVGQRGFGITADARGDVFTKDVGVLRRHGFVAGAPRPAADGVVADLAWLDYDLVVGAGDNVFYGRDSAGRLFRFRYDTVSQRWTEHRRQVGAGWGMFDKVFSPGGDVLYGIAGNTLYWYRFDAETGTWANGGNGRVVGSGWSGRTAVTATTDTCSVPAPAPVPPATPLPAAPNGPLATVGAQNPSAAFGFAYLDATNHAVVARDSGAGLDVTPLGGPTFPGGLTTGTTARAQSVVGLDGQGTVWVATGTPAGQPVWSPFRSTGGSFTAVRKTDASLVAIDAGGRLWYRTWSDGAWGGWWDMSGPVGFTGELSAASSNGTTYGVARRADGSVHSFHVLMWGINIGKDTAYRTGPLPGAADFGLPTPATVNHGEMLVARHTATARPFAMFGSEGDWDEAWTPLPALDLADAPMSAAQTRNNSRAVAALGTDGYVYVTGETGDATRQFRTWQRVGDTKAVTPPTLTAPGQGDVEVAFRGADGKLHHYTAPVRADWYAPFEFTGGPRG